MKYDRPLKPHLKTIIEALDVKKKKTFITDLVIPLLPLPPIEGHIVQLGSPCCFQTRQMSPELNPLTSIGALANSCIRLNVFAALKASGNIQSCRSPFVESLRRSDQDKHFTLLSVFVQILAVDM